MTETARLGILMLDTRFPRIVGDVGNPDTWGFPVRLHRVKGATPSAIVQADPAPFVDAFVEAGHALIDQGCTGIATTCGFLSLIRPRLAAELGVPVAASALEQAALIRSSLAPASFLGVLTISADSLSAQHLRVAGVPEDTVVCGVDRTEFAASILNNQTTLDMGQARQDLVAAATEMVAEYPDIGAIVLECTNMPPYAADIARATGRPVFSIVTYLNWFHAGLQPARYSST